VNHKKCKNLDYGSSLKLYQWLASDDAAAIIRNYRVSNSHVFYID
jgi:ABC-type tungstate transport system permease subunit